MMSQIRESSIGPRYYTRALATHCRPKPVLALVEATDDTADLPAADTKVSSQHEFKFALAQGTTELSVGRGAAMSLCRLLEQQCVVFEPANIFYDDTAIWRWLGQLLGKFRVQTHFEAFYCLWRYDFLPQMVPSNCRQVVDQFLAEIGLRRGQREEVLTAFLPRWQSSQRHPRSLPKTVATLNHLARTGLQMAVWDRHCLDAHGLATQLSTLGIGSLLAPITETSKYAGEASVWEVLLSELDCPADQLVLVTCDSWTAVQAQEAGITSVVCNDFASNSQVRHIARLEQLPTLFGGNVRMSRAA
jgi:hypothetical protein